MATNDENPPIVRVLNLFGDRWSLLIVWELLRGTVRFSDFMVRIPRISRTVLAARLRDLKEAGVVTRYQVNECRTRYELTEAGEALAAPLSEMSTWAQAWLQPGPSSDTGSSPARREVELSELGT